MADAAWEVHTKGRIDSSFEVAVVRADNEHGKRSYGWRGDEKILISGSDRVYARGVPLAWDSLLAMAHSVAAALNGELAALQAQVAELKEANEWLSGHAEQLDKNWHAAHELAMGHIRRAVAIEDDAPVPHLCAEIMRLRGLELQAKNAAHVASLRDAQEDSD